MDNFFTAKDILAIPHIRESISKDYHICTEAYKDYFTKIGQSIELNSQVLHEALASAYCDMYRLTVFRGIKNADRHKRAAFLVKWITKLRPICIRAYPKDSILQ